MRDWRVWVGIALVIGVIAVLVVVATGSNNSGLAGIFPAKKLGPKATAAKVATAGQADFKEATRILDQGFATRVSCTSAVQNRFAPVMDESEVTPHSLVYTYQWPDGQVECYEAPAGTGIKLIHRVTGKPLVPMTDEQAAAIVKAVDADSGEPFWSPPHRNAPRPAATPNLPELGTRPCCRP